MTAPALKLVDPFSNDDPAERHPRDEATGLRFYGYAGSIAEGPDLSEADRTAIDAFDRKADMLPPDSYGERRAQAVMNLALFGINKGIAPAEILRGCRYGTDTAGYRLTEATIKDAVQRAIKRRMGVVDDTTEDAAHGRRFKLQPFNAIKAELDKVWLIEDVLPPNALALLFAAPNELKTFTAAGMCFAIARGAAWHDRRTEIGTAVYLAAEGNLANRIQAYRQHHALHNSSIPFFLVQDSANMGACGDADALIQAAGEAADLGGYPVQIIVIDTLNMVLGGNENDSGDMSVLLKAVARIQRATGSTILIIHHSGKDSTKGARGHSSLLAAVDTAMEIKDGVLTVVKQRDGERGARYGLRLVPVEIGTDARGKVVTSCVVEPVSAGALQAFKGQQIKAGSVAANALTVLEDMTMGAPGKPALAAEWQAEFIRRYYDGANRKTSAKAFERARATLIRANHISIEGEHVTAQS